MEKSISLDHMTLGVCYYPEHWDESLWENDLDRMLACGIEAVRVFEFAWNLVEPQDGIFDFTLFDRFLDLAAKKGMKVIMCTPTATPPAWLTYKYPEVLNVTYDGTPYCHGHRRHYNYNSKVYQFYTERIVETLGKHFDNHPAIVGWQLDNELNCEVNEFYSDSDREAFRSYLKEHFKTLDALNDAIGGRFWNISYTDWNEVDLRRLTPGKRFNPHMALLEKRFFSKSCIRYAKLQSDILRKYIGNRFITTNGVFGHLDSHEMTNNTLDFITYDSYPAFAYGDGMVEDTAAGRTLGDRAWSAKLSTVRSISPNFGIMEQQSGAGGANGSRTAPMPKPGMMRLWTMQSVAHGADYVSYFRWRTAPYGEEIYWHALNDYSNLPNRRIRELEGIHEDFVKLRDVTGSRYEAKVGLVCDYLNEWDGELDIWHGPLDSSSRQAIFAAAQHNHTPIDMVYIRKTNTYETKLEDLSKYDVLFYPHATILTQSTASLLHAYCENGGKLIMGARTGYKDEYGRCPMVAMPGFARELCGTEVVDYTTARKDEIPVTIRLGDQALPAPDFHDVLRPVDGGHALGFFQNGFFSGEPAVICKDYPNNGKAFYVGAGFAEDMVKSLLEITGVFEPYSKDISCHKDIELACRATATEHYFFLLNYSSASKPVILGRKFKNLLDGKTLMGTIDIAPYDVLVLKAEK